MFIPATKVDGCYLYIVNSQPRRLPLYKSIFQYTLGELQLCLEHTFGNLKKLALIKQSTDITSISLEVLQITINLYREHRAKKMTTVQFNDIFRDYNICLEVTFFFFQIICFNLERSQLLLAEFLRQRTGFKTLLFCPTHVWR